MSRAVSRPTAAGHSIRCINQLCEVRDQDVREFSNCCCALGRPSVVGLPTMASRSTPSSAISFGPDRRPRAFRRRRAEVSVSHACTAFCTAVRRASSTWRCVCCCCCLAWRTAAYSVAALIDRHRQVRGHLIAVGPAWPMRRRCSAGTPDPAAKPSAATQRARYRPDPWPRRRSAAPRSPADCCSRPSRSPRSRSSTERQRLRRDKVGGRQDADDLLKRAARRLQTALPRSPVAPRAPASAASAWATSVCG